MFNAKAPRPPCGARLAITDPGLPEDQLRLEFEADKSVRLINLGRSLTLESGRRVRQGENIGVALPARIFVANTTVVLRDEDESVALDPFLKSIESSRHAGEVRPFTLDLFGRSPAPETIVHWLTALAKLQAAAAGSAEFLTAAAQAIVETVGLDTGLILLRSGDGWQIAATHLRSSEQSAISFQRRVVEQAAASNSTLYHDSQALRNKITRHVEAVVAAPIFDQLDEVAGIVYGVRSPHRQNERRGIRRLEAQLVQLLAETMTIGLERQRREAEAARTRILLEQAFSPELVRELQHNPDMLLGHEREITVLFCDLRDFFEISEQLGPHETYRFLGDVMNRLTEAIMASQGVIIDYYGDGLAAMWNAPTDQPNHAELACRAALAMQGELPAINAAWHKELGRDLALGIGIHTGLAQVGNAGTPRRIKYGPRGSMVNLASRVEGATKRLGVPLLLTDQTRRHLPSTMITRRCLRAQLAGAAAPVDLYELVRSPLDGRLADRLQTYDEALALFEAGNLDGASERLSPLMRAGQDEDAALQFLWEHIQQLRQETGLSSQAGHRPMVSVVELAK